MSYSNAVALQMPSSYVLMSNEEMEYLEGGADNGGTINGVLNGGLANLFKAAAWTSMAQSRNMRISYRYMRYYGML